MRLNRTILIVDDEPRTRSGLKKLLESWGAGQYEIKTADNGRDARQLMEQEPVHLLITDIRMPEVSGLNLVEAIKQMPLRYKPAVILISGHAEFSYAQQGIQLGVVNYLLKPISRQKLIAAVEEALELAGQRSRMDRMEKLVDPKLMELDNGTKPLSEPVKETMAYIEAHLHLSFGLREAAEHIHLNPSYLSVLFKEQTGMTFSEYVARRKLLKAKELLLQTKLPVAEISERLGYQTPKYFNKLFKDYEGRSPGQYRTEMAAPEAAGKTERQDSDSDLD
ncbi:DNA-binding response regulator [Paenibacillus sambharensis]|uniref:DNA-binding response regulator n=1 Tax=Paenibacillus sambharensis TaxID=1803190 RepID=A0A2W1LQH9_9BACL|nr:response regulator [Paenibacillus sambharensis]PZD96764.1 DNA-binding response regulator [Paenibacillus sambharensis]